MAQPATRTPENRSAMRRVLRGWAVTVGFLGGLVVGAVLTGLLSSGAQLPADTGGGTAAPETSAEAPRTDGGESAGATGEVTINAACLRAINAAQDMVGVVEDLGEAISGFNAARLDEIVRRLQPLERRLDENAGDCEVEGRVPTDAPSESAGETASPTN
jgi:hypothetical protein